MAISGELLSISDKKFVQQLSISIKMI